jgi:prephenate dehydrogenase
MGHAEPPQSIAVVGLGLIGASLCGALRRDVGGVRITGIARRPETAARALNDGVCDVGGTDASLLAGAELVVLCTPVDVMPEWLEMCRRHAPDALVTDCGSTKAWIVEQAASILPPGRFLGGHPMAGRESSGYDAADPTLFTGCTWVLTPRHDDDLAAFAPWSACIESLGAHIEVLTATTHDIAAAWISHLPFALSAALMRAAAGAGAWPEAQRLAAGGFRDMARLAGGDAAMYGAITATNTEAITAALDALESELRSLRTVLGDHTAAAGYFASGREVRRSWLEARAQSGRPVR